MVNLHERYSRKRVAGKQYLSQTDKLSDEEPIEEMDRAEFARSVAASLEGLVLRHRAKVAESSDTLVETC